MRAISFTAFRAAGLARVRRLGRALANLMPFVTLLLIAVEWNGIPGQRRDTLAYYNAAAAARTDGDAIYTGLRAGPHENTGNAPYIYPPVLAALLSFIPASSYEWFDRGWLIANAAALWLLAIALSRIASGRYGWRSIRDWSALVFAFPGTWLAIHFANIDLMLLAMLAWGLLLPAASGALYGAAALLKVTPGLALIVVLWTRQWLALKGVLIATVLGALACLVAYGFGDSLTLFDHWLTVVLPTLSQGQFWGESIDELRRGGLRIQDVFYNCSLSFLPVQLAVLLGWDYSGGPLPVAVRAYLTAFSILVPAVTWYALRHRTITLQLAAVTAAVLWSGPIVRPYVLPAALFIVAALLAERRTRDDAEPPRVSAAGETSAYLGGV